MASHGGISSSSPPAPRTRGFSVASIAAAVALAACTVEGQDIATTFADPTANPMTTPPPTTSEGDSSEATGGSAETTPPADSGESSPPATTTADSGSASTGAPPADEQPEDGMYSACAGVGECIGLTTCVMAGGMGFCSSGCMDPIADCDPNPGASSTAPALCVDDGTGLQVCALSCAMGQACPGGMECVALGATMVCA